MEITLALCRRGGEDGHVSDCCDSGAERSDGEGGRGLGGGVEGERKGQTYRPTLIAVWASFSPSVVARSDLR